MGILFIAKDVYDNSVLFLDTLVDDYFVQFPDDSKIKKISPLLSCLNVKTKNI